MPVLSEVWGSAPRKPSKIIAHLQCWAHDVDARVLSIQGLQYSTGCQVQDRLPAKSWVVLPLEDTPLVKSCSPRLPHCMYSYASLSAVPSVCVYCMYMLCYCRRVQKTGKARRMESPSVVIGAHKLSEKAPSQKRLQLTRVIVDRAFLKHRPARDLALLKLDSTITFTRKVAAICVDRSRFPDYFTLCYATGWGKRSVNGLNLTMFSLSF